MQSLRAPNDIQGWKWAGGIMGCQSNGLTIKKPNEPNSPSRGLRFHETEPPQINTSSSPSFPLQLCVLQSSGITESTFPALLPGAVAYFLYLDKVKRRSGVLAGSDSWCCFYGGRLTVNWIVPRVQSSALSPESFPSLHIPRVLTTSSHSSMQY